MDRSRLALIAGPLLFALVVMFGVKTSSSTSVAPAAAAPAAPAATPKPEATATPFPAPAATVAGAAPPTAAAPSDVPTRAPAAARPVGLNERAVLAGQAITLLRVSRADTTPGLTRVLAEVLIEGVGDAAPYTPRYFTLVDAAGASYAAVSDGELALGSGELAAGASVRGTVAFAVPNTAAGLVLQYQPLRQFGVAAPLRIALPE